MIKNKPTQMSLHAVTLLYLKGDKKTVQPQGSDSLSVDDGSGDEDSEKENHPDGGDKAGAQGDTAACAAVEGDDTLKTVGNIL
jgi:hypothetical protein